MNYPNKDVTVALLLDAARRAAEERNVVHPEDIASAMLNAIEASAPVILECYKAFSPKE